MKKRIIIIITVLFISFLPAFTADAHSGRTDSSGGHKCSDKSIAKGLCSGYHYHNGGSTKSTSSKSASTNTSTSTTMNKAVAKPASTTIDIYINNVKQSFTPGAYIKNGTTLVPMKKTFDALGANVAYDANTKTITAKKTTKKLHLQ